MKIALVTVASSSGEKGGAERFYEGLASALSDAGAVVDSISLISDESNFDAIKESYLRFYELDLSKYDGVVSTKSPSYIINHPKHVCYFVFHEICGFAAVFASYYRLFASERFKSNIAVVFVKRNKRDG